MRTVQLTSQELERLVREAQQGSSEAFGVLYALWLTPVYRYVALRVGFRPQAEDLTEEVFLRCLESLSSFRWRGEGSFSAWLFRIAHNLVVDSLRKEARRQAMPLDTIATLPAGEASVAEEVVEGIWIRRAVSTLTSLQQAVVGLRFGSGLSIQETARAMGKSQGAVKALQHAALGALRKALVGPDDAGQARSPEEKRLR